MKIAISGLWYPISMMRYFYEGFDKLQRHRDDLEIWTCGPSFGSWIPWNGGINLSPKYALYPDFPLPKTSANVHIHPQMIVDRVPNDIDIWLQIDAGWHFSARPPAKIVVLIETDPHCIKRTYDLPKSYSDITFCMQSNYMESDEVFLPYGVPDFFISPTMEILDRTKIYDACLIGLHYLHRNDLVSSLRKQGLNIYYDLGIVYYELRQLYLQSKLSLSWSSLQDTPVRVFEAMGMNIPLIANKTPDLCTLFIENEHFLGFSTLNDAIEKVNWALNNIEKAEEMSMKAHFEVFEKHKFSHRCQQILDAVERMH